MSDRPRMWIGGVEIPVESVSLVEDPAERAVQDTIYAFNKLPRLHIECSRATISPAMQKLIDVYRFCRADPHWVSMWWYSPERDIVRQRRKDKRWQSSRRFREYVFKWALEAGRGVTDG